MMAASSGLTAADVLDFLDQRAKEQQPAPVAPGLRAAYREAAAVLAAIPRPEDLVPVGFDDAVGSATEILRDELIPAHGRNFEGPVMLAPGPRREAIAALVEGNRISAALDANPGQRTGALQKHLERYLLADGPPVDTQTLPELERTQQVVHWLDGVVAGLPTEDAVVLRAAWLRLLAPFEAIAGDHIFRGRTKELDELRTYVGVLAPKSIRARLETLAFKWLEPVRQPALSISGPGGVGKSALVARFMLEHTRGREEQRVPFAYLDFDRAALDVGDPAGLAFEMGRQLDLQFPTDRRFGWLRPKAEGKRTESFTPSKIPDEHAVESARSVLRDMLGIMSKVLENRPYVVVLDTFEEVQYRGESRAFPLWELLGELQEEYPFLRVVISGRAPVDSLRLANRAPNQLVIGDLDKDAALAFIKAQGVKDVALAERLHRAFGGVPLTLKLVAALAARYEDDLSDPVLRGKAWSNLTGEQLQGQLYDRILDHVKDPQVRRLASPGLVLRRINPEVILEVLNVPCELQLKSLADARNVMEELRRETSLVSVDDADGDLVHRADLRRVMLKLLARDDPGRVGQIRMMAVAWYEKQTGRRARAEELYHRLHLGYTVEPSDLRDSEVRASIQTSIIEFEPEVQLQLAGLGFQVPAETLEVASAAQQDASLAAQVEELLPYGRGSELEAERILDGPTRGLDRVSRLYRSAARVAAQRGDRDGAAIWIERGLEQSATGPTRIKLELLQEKAWLYRDAPAPARAEALDELGDAARRERDAPALIQRQLQQLDADEQDRGRARAAFRAVLEELPALAVWEFAPAFGPAVALALRHEDDESLAELQNLVLSEGSGFRFAVFPDDRVQSVLEAALRTSESDPREFGSTFSELCKVWPYRVLSVVPPYGRRGEQLSESAA